MDKKAPPPVEIPDEINEQLKQLKNKLEKFKKELLKKFDKYIVGIALLPQDKENKKLINILLLVDDSDSKEITRTGLRDKLFSIVDKLAKEIDPNLKPDTLLKSELIENCYDGKYELISLIGASAILYDPFDILAAVKISEVHKGMVIRKFDKYVVSYIAAGSLFRGEKSHDIDVFILVDDTDVKKMSRFELRDKLRAIIIQMGFQAADITGVKKQFHIQVYILTDFWEWVKDASPVIFTVLRDGVPLFDKGLFMPWKLLLKMGRIRPSPEAIDVHMNVGEKSVEIARSKLLGIVSQDLYYGVLNPAQAALMLYGISPPTHRETIKLLDEIFVKKEKILEEKYVKILEKLFKIFKDVEHGKIKDISGKELDLLLQDADDYLKRIKKLFNQIEKKAEAKTIVEIYNNCITIAKDVIALEKVNGSVESGFKELVKRNIIPERFYGILNAVIKAKKDYDSKKLTKQELEKVRKSANIFVSAMLEYIQRKRGAEIERARVRFKYGDKFGEIYLLDDEVFIINDMDSKQKDVAKATIEDGRLQNIQKSNLIELESALSKKKIPKQVFINEHIFEDLKKLYGEDIKISVNY